MVLTATNEETLVEDVELPVAAEVIEEVENSVEDLESMEIETASESTSLDEAVPASRSFEDLVASETVVENEATEQFRRQALV